jgi:hypothetical protein
MKIKLTRRKLAQAMLGSAAAGRTLAQTAATTPEADLKTARDRMKANSDALAAQELPMSTEPAFQFRA